MITMLYAGLCTLLVIALALRVVLWRRQHKIGIGDGGNHDLQKRVRAHANAIENIPLALILLGGMELNGVDATVVHGFGGVLFLSRLAHAAALSRSSGASFGRFFGSLFTWLLMITMAVVAIAGYFLQFRVV